MELSGIGRYQAARGSYVPQKGKTDAQADEKKAAGAGRDTVVLSGSAGCPKVPQKQFPKAEEAGEPASGGEDTRRTGVEAKAPKAPQTRADAGAEEEAAGDQSGSSGRVGINAAKLARMLAAAKTRSQVQAVIAKIQADLKECEAGAEQGMDVDEASVEAAERLLQEAKSRLGSAEDREATPQEELASALASLM